MTDDHGDRLRDQARAILPAEPNVVPDVAIGLERLCQAAMQELGFDQVSVTLMTTAGSSVLVASAGPPGPGIQELQFDLGEGPGHDAYVLASSRSAAVAAGNTLVEVPFAVSTT